MTEPSPHFRRFAEPNRFTVGAIGEPGSRVFYFQLFADGSEINLKCEKQQAAALAERVVSLLADLPADPTPTLTGHVAAVEALPPTHIEWPVGSISIGVEWEQSRIVVVFEEMIMVDDDDDLLSSVDPAKVQVHLTPDQIRGFAEQVGVLTGQSRPICRLCGQPIDPTGHACPRLN